MMTFLWFQETAALNLVVQDLMKDWVDEARKLIYY